MNNYASLLESCGIFDHGIPPDSPPPPVFEEALGANEELYEFWDWGPHVLHNLNEPGCLHPFAIDYADEQTYDWVKKHRYNRRARFKYTLCQLLNTHGTVPDNVRQIVKRDLKLVKASRKKIWNQTRAILKRHKFQRHYNQIPDLIKFCTNLTITAPPALYWNVINDFERMHHQFNNSLAHKWKRLYFPNLRFIALKLIAKHGGTFPYTVPLVRTLRKQKYLNELFLGFSLDNVVLEKVDSPN